VLVYYHGIYNTSHTVLGLILTHTAEVCESVCLFVFVLNKHEHKITLIYICNASRAWQMLSKLFISCDAPRADVVVHKAEGLRFVKEIGSFV
jgi:hypothetical protein